ncbi:unnamed protein product [Nippostrongylus brasiliensis]|uniref:Uncharacterized protein n=1 Tax=Nippostrongylus brasiliensis TaxID=27835 RepID=A0A0N4XXP0_NIPBR|nr:unnamed protein product [Nippostrongylus brasiliensis]
MSSTAGASCAQEPSPEAPGGTPPIGRSSPKDSNPDVGLPETETVRAPDEPDLERILAQRFSQFFKVAHGSYDRRPVRRPEKVNPKVLLEIGDAVLLRKQNNLPTSNGRRCISTLNAAVYAIAKGIAATADELRRGDVSRDPKRRLKELMEGRRSRLSVVSAHALAGAT